MSAVTDHYFRTPEGPERRQDVTVRAWGQDLVLRSATGVFSHGRLDKATDVLLRHTESPRGAETVLDLGCGWGPIACLLARQAPAADVWAVDVNERALALTSDNARSLGVGVRAVLPDQVPEDLRFDTIWSNPPIRIGKSALHELLQHWLPRLAPEGEAHLVVGRNLGADSLQRWLDEQGWPTERRASEKGFRVLTTRRG
jgi:16S rRNA (guanine1207-N2)-methyltransferase